MEIIENNNNEIKSEDILNALNKHFVELGYNLSQSLPIPKFTHDHNVNRVNDQFSFYEISHSEVLKLLQRINMPLDPCISTVTAFTGTHKSMES